MKLLAAVLALGMGSVWAQEPAAPVASVAPVRAARLTFVAGAVRVQRADNTAEDAPVLNMPLGEGTRLVTGDYGQAEVEFEDGSVVRMTPRSALSLDTLTLESGMAKTGMTLLGGMAYFELRKAAGSGFSLTAGGVGVELLENATVRVNAEGPAVFAVLTGKIRVERVDGFRANVATGESLRVDAKDPGRYYLSDGVVEESWDRWNESRDQMAADEADKRTDARAEFAGNQGYGWSDLDANGTWYDTPGGQVWQPDVADEGFDPYGYGNWVWSSVGYVWASGYAWGWTPFRCGRWTFQPGFGWGWMAGRGCANWGSEGGGVLIGGTHRPPHFHPVPLPPAKGPGHVHPIIPVKGPDGPRPPVLPGGIRRVGGQIWTPIARVGSGLPRSGSTLGFALNRDYPIDAKTHKAVLGATQNDAGGVVLGNRPAPPVAGWKAVEAKPRPGRAPAATAGETRTAGESNRVSPARTTHPVEREPGATKAPVAHSPSATSPAPVRAPVTTAPVPAPAPVVQRPAPAPAPVAAPHPAPAPAPAAAPRVDSTQKPK